MKIRLVKLRAQRLLSAHLPELAALLAPAYACLMKPIGNARFAAVFAI